MGLENLNPIMAGVSGGINTAKALFEMITGVKQRREGKAGLESLVRPIYQRPEEITQLQTLSALNSMSGLPNENVLMDMVGANTANTLSAAADFGGSAGAYKAQINQNNSILDIGYKSAEQRMKNMVQNMQTLQLAADYSDKEFDINKYIPFQEDRKRYLDMIGGGTQNVSTGLNTAANTASAFIGNELFGGGSKSAKRTTAQPSSKNQIFSFTAPEF